jgi:hypothetical protein
MKKLLIVLAALMIPTIVMAGNTAPKLWLEVYNQSDDPFDPEGPGFLVNPCVHPRPVTYPFTLPCFAPKVQWMYYVVPVHVGQLDMPLCTTTGQACQGYGGYLGLGFGAAMTGGSGMSFLNWNACPGFLKGPSASGEPSSMLASSTSLCHDWVDHEGYMIWQSTSTATTARYINIVASTDLGHNKLINCHNQYDEGTVIGGGVQIGGTQTILCGESPTAVNATTWGAIKGLYR